MDLTAQTGRVTPAYLARNNVLSAVDLTAQTGRGTPAYLARNNVLSAVGLTARSGHVKGQKPQCTGPLGTDRPCYCG